MLFEFYGCTIGKESQTYMFVHYNCDKIMQHSCLFLNNLKIEFRFKVIGVLGFWGPQNPKTP